MNLKFMNSCDMPMKHMPMSEGSFLGRPLSCLARPVVHLAGFVFGSVGAPRLERSVYAPRFRLGPDLESPVSSFCT